MAGKAVTTLDIQMKNVDSRHRKETITRTKGSEGKRELRTATLRRQCMVVRKNKQPSMLIANWGYQTSAKI